MAVKDKESGFQESVVENPDIPREILDRDALAVIHRLKTRHFEAYLVGGCVRDLLVGKIPKDFDIATSARPRQVKKIFKNCRIIGKRFKLAHLYFGEKILEVSTFRKTPEGLGENGDGDLLIKRDNVYGTAREDALRRDFTINSLFYDPLEGKLIDWVGGLEDLKKRRIRTIGDPWTRFKEDPVRILRAVKFSTRLDFEIESHVWEAMRRVSQDLKKSAPPRILEEILRLLRSGNSLNAFQLLRDSGCLDVVLPELADWLRDSDCHERDRFWRHLEALDAVVQNEMGNPSSALLLAVLFIEVIESMSKNGEDPSAALERIFTPFATWTRLPRRERSNMKKICLAQRRFSDEKKRRKTRTFLCQEYFHEAMKLFQIRCLALGDNWRAYWRWKEKISSFGLDRYWDPKTP